MKINILATGIELTPAIYAYVEKRIRAVEKYIDSENEDIVAKVEVGRVTQHHRSGEIFRAEVHITGGGHDLYASTEEEDLYTAIDKVKDEISKEARRRKGKRSTMLRKGQQTMKNAVKGFPWGLKRIKFKKFKRDKEAEE